MARRAAHLVSTTVVQGVLERRIGRLFPGNRLVALAAFPQPSIRSVGGIVRYHLTLARAGKRREILVFGNTGPQAPFLCKVFQFVRTHGFAGPRLFVPRPLGYWPSHHLFLYEAFPGQTVRRLLERNALSDAPLRHTLEAAGSGLGRFNRLTPPNWVPRARPADDRARARQWRRVLVRVPGGRALLPLVEQIVALRRALAGQERTAFLHRDPHVANIVIEGGRTAFIDLGGANRGLGSDDIGRFLVHLDVELSRHVPTAINRRLQARTFGAWRRAAGPLGRSLPAVNAAAAWTALEFFSFTATMFRTPSATSRSLLTRFSFLARRAGERARSGSRTLFCD